ncbi:MAG: PhnD/SsuA/transferrin family substrate-binding protein [Pseudomonadota bacterium]
MIGQTCGLPLIRGEAGAAVPFARPTYDVPGCESGTYSSAVVVRRGSGATLQDFLERRVAMNGHNSQSGCNALKDAYLTEVAHTGPYFSSLLLTGSHRASADAVADGSADLCALDAVAWALYQFAEPDRAAGLEPIHWTRPMPSLPFITSAKHSDRLPDLRAALAEAVETGAIGIPAAILSASIADYDPVREMDLNLKDVTLAPHGSA